MLSCFIMFRSKSCPSPVPVSNNVLIFFKYFSKCLRSLYSINFWLQSKLFRFCLVVFFLLIAKIIPPTNIVVPLISKYLLFTFIMNIMSVFNTCFVINLYFQNLKVDTMHPFIHVALFRVLPAILFIRRPISTARRPPVKPTPAKVPKTKDTHMKYANFSPLLENYKFTFDEKSETFQKLNRSAASGYAASSQFTCNDKIKKRSNLYNFEKIKSSFETDNEGSLNKSYSRILYKGLQSNSSKNYVTLDNIKETKTLVNASRSIQYISHIMKAKSDIKEAIILIFLFIYHLFIQMKLIVIHLDTRRLEVFGVCYWSFDACYFRVGHIFWQLWYLTRFALHFRRK